MRDGKPCSCLTSVEKAPSLPHVNTATLPRLPRWRGVESVSVTPYNETPDQRGLFHLLLQTIALEELALSALINAQAETVQHITQQGIAGPILPEEAIRVNESVRDVLISVSRKEDTVLKRLRLLLEAKKDHLPPICRRESAWAAEAVGEIRFVEPGPWATYVRYCRNTGSQEDPREYPIYAGQTHLAGSLLVWNVEDVLHVVYTALDSDEHYDPEQAGGWGILAVHLHVGESAGNIPRTIVGGTLGGPIPGQFEYQWSDDDDGFGLSQHVVEPLEVSDRCNGDQCLVIAAHAVMVWCPNSRNSSPAEMQDQLVYF